MKLQLSAPALNIMREFCRNFTEALSYIPQQQKSLINYATMQKLHRDIVNAQNTGCEVIEVTDMQTLKQAFNIAAPLMDRHVKSYVEHIISDYNG